MRFYTQGPTRRFEAWDRGPMFRSITTLDAEAAEQDALEAAVRAAGGRAGDGEAVEIDPALLPPALVERISSMWPDWGGFDLVGASWKMERTKEERDQHDRRAFRAAWLARGYDPKPKWADDPLPPLSPPRMDASGGARGGDWGGARRAPAPAPDRHDAGLHHSEVEAA